MMTHFLCTLLFIAASLTASLALFLFIQKPLFLLYNRKSHPLSAAAVRQVYRHGLRLDLAAAGYLVLLPTVIMAIGQLWPSSAIVTALWVYTVVAAVIVALISAADTVLYGFWDSKLDASVLMYLNSKGKFSSVSTMFLAGCLTGFMLLVVIMGAILALPLMLLDCNATAVTAPWWARLLSCGGILLLGAVIYLCLIWGRLRMPRRFRKKVKKPNSPAKAFFSSEPFQNHAALNPFYNFVYTLSYSKRLDEEFRFMKADEAEAVYKRYLLDNGGHSGVSTDGPALLSTSRPNILLVMMESYGAPFVKALGGYDGVTPCFEQLIKEGVFFNHCYCSSIRTDRAIVSIESGYPGQPTYSIIKVSHKIATLPGLPKALRAEGYDTQLVHGGDLSIFNKYEYYQLCGHNTLVSINDFPESQRQQRWGVPDHLIYEWMTDDIKRRHNEQPGQPCMMSVQTLSSHLPYDVPWQIMDDKVLNCYAYADRALGQFIDRLKAMPEVWNNLLVICMADHGMPYNGLRGHMPAFAHIPWLMIGGAVKQPMIVEKVVSQTDLPATVLAMMGLNHDNFIFSRDVFSSAYRYPCAFNTYNNGLMFRDANGCTVFDNTSQKVTYGPDSDREHAGKGILQYLYQDLSRR